MVIDGSVQGVSGSIFLEYGKEEYHERSAGLRKSPTLIAARNGEEDSGRSQRPGMPFKWPPSS